MPEEDRRAEIRKLEFERDVRLVVIKDMKDYNDYKAKVNQEQRIRHEAGSVLLGFPDPWKRSEFPVTFSRKRTKSNLAPKKTVNPTARPEERKSSFLSYDQKKEVIQKKEERKLYCKVVIQFWDEEFEFDHTIDRHKTTTDLKEELLKIWCHNHIIGDTAQALKKLRDSSILIKDYPFDQREGPTLLFLLGDEQEAVVYLSVPMMLKK